MLFAELDFIKRMYKLLSLCDWNIVFCVKCWYS